MNKVTEEELKNIIDHQKTMDKLVVEVGIIETRKHALLHEVGNINTATEDMKKLLFEKYGNVEINMEDGTYTTKEDEVKEEEKELVEIDESHV
jgi:hypothetical protein